MRKITLAICLLLFSISQVAAEDAAASRYYASRFYLAGLLLRASSICPKDFKRTVTVALSLIATPELKRLSSAFPKTTEDWMSEGASALNREVMQEGIDATCAHAIEVRGKADKIVSEDRHEN